MLTLNQLLDSCAHETKIIQHLATKMPEGGLDYRPTDGQRTMLELMQYMTRMGAVAMTYANDESWDRGVEMGKQTEAVTPENFHAEMDRQMEILREEAAKLDGKSFDSPTQMPWQEPCTLGQFLVNAVLKTFPVYRMQYFLYLKSAGATELNSMDCWFGAAPQEGGQE